MRAYAITKDYAVGYGEERKVITLPKGTCRWSYNNGGSPEENDRINYAVNAIPADTAAPSSVYSVSGVKIGVDPSDSDALRHGMYVIDGRKVVKER